MAEPSKQRDSSRESWIFTHFPRSSKKLHYTKKGLASQFLTVPWATWLLTSHLPYLFCCFCKSVRNEVIAITRPFIQLVNWLIGHTFIHGMSQNAFSTWHICAKIMTRRGSTHFSALSEICLKWRCIFVPLSCVSPPYVLSWAEKDSTLDLQGFSNSNTKASSMQKYNILLRVVCHASIKLQS